MLIPPPLERLLKQLGRLPGLGPRSAQRVALHLLTTSGALADLVRTLSEVGSQLHVCRQCGNLGLAEVCHICADEGRDRRVLCVVESVADVWALERSGVFKGRYHVLGGLVDALEGRGPDDVRLPELVQRVREEGINEVIVAVTASVTGQTTMHLIGERLANLGVAVTTLAKGMPVGAAVDYLDEGTLQLALAGRQRI